MSALIRCVNRFKAFNGRVLLTFVDQPCTQQSASISSKALRELNGIKRPPPYDYRNKKFNVFRSWFDHTAKRFDENTKIIVVEGPIGVGKTDFAQQLAEELDMYYIPQASMDDVYINEFGFDYRTLDDKLPPGARTFDEKKFLADPSNRLTASFQLNMYHLKYCDYLEALMHLLSSGQGVVMENSVFSDIVFLETLYKHNLIKRESYKGILDTYDNTLFELLKPHLVIYLDVPANLVLEKIKKANKNNAANSPLFKDTKFLELMEKNYKNIFLKDINPHSELLVYDWSNGGEVELVVEDIEHIDFDNYVHASIKLRDWRYHFRNGDWTESRIKYATRQDELVSMLDLPLYHCPDLLLSGEDCAARDEVYGAVDNKNYEYGYNEHLGDEKILFKTKSVPPKKRKMSSSLLYTTRFG